MSNRDFYWRKDWFESLSKISSADTNELWKGYQAYCEFQEKGIRKIAFKHLYTFIDSIYGESLENRMLFVRWIMPLAHSSPNFEQLLPHPVIEKLIKPTIEESLEQLPGDPDLLFWRGHLLRDYESLHQAIHLYPQHIASRSLLIEWKLGFVDYATHHLPYYFIGDTQDALEVCDEVENLLHSSLPLKRSKMFEDEILEYREMIKVYLTSK